MNYNDFGKTGEKVSSLGFGCMRLPEYQENEEWFIKKTICWLQERWRKSNIRLHRLRAL